MRRLLSFFLAALLPLSLCACGAPQRTAIIDRNISKLDITEWKHTESSEYGESYAGILTSDRIMPFAAVVPDPDANPALIYMEDGTGTVKEYISKSSGKKLEFRAPIGYCLGDILSEEDLTSMDYTLDYYDYESLKESSCSADVTFQLKNQADGFLFANIWTDLDKDKGWPGLIPVLGGAGEYSYSVYDQRLGARIQEVSMEPKLFLPCYTLEPKESKIVEAFSAEREDNDYSSKYVGVIKYQVKGVQDGYILYTEKLVSGGNVEDIGKETAHLGFLQDEILEINTYDYVSEEDRDSFEEPVYEFSVKGYLPWAPIEGKTSTEIVEPLPSPAHDAYEEACNIQLSDLDHTSPMGLDIYKYKGLLLDTEYVTQFTPGHWLEKADSLDGGMLYDAIAHTLADYLRVYPDGFVSQYGVEFWTVYGDFCTLMWDTSQTNDDTALQPKFREAASWIIEQEDGNPFFSIMKRFSECETVEGTYPFFENSQTDGTFIVDIPDLTATAKELGITETALGYVLGKLHDYVAPDQDGYEISFNENSFHLEVFWEALPE